MGAAAWPRNRPDDSGCVRGPASNRAWLAVSGASSPRKAGLDRRRMESFGDQQARQILSPHGAWQEAAVGRGEQVEPAGEDHRADHETGIGVYDAVVVFAAAA